MGTWHADTACGDILYSFHPSGWLSNSEIVVDREMMPLQVVVVFCHKYLCTVWGNGSMGGAKTTGLSVQHDGGQFACSKPLIFTTSFLCRS